MCKEHWHEWIPTLDAEYDECAICHKLRRLVRHDTYRY